MTPIPDPERFAESISRRAFLRQSAYGLGSLAFGLLAGDPARAQPPSAAGSWHGVLHTPSYPIRARRIIHLCMAGGPSHLETLDNKPMLRKMHGQPFPESLTKGQQLAQLQNTALKVFGSVTNFQPGESPVRRSPTCSRTWGASPMRCASSARW
jgi:hypothetical protein